MHMSAHEIVQMYKEAADKNAQIRILADLNTCSQKDILLVLQNEGVISGVKPKKEKSAPKTERKRRKLETVWDDELKNDVRRFLADGLPPMEIAERLGLEPQQVRNAIHRYDLREEKEDNPSTGAREDEREALERADDKPTASANEHAEPLSVVSLIRDYAKCITALQAADIRNYERIVRTFCESIIEGADSIIREAEQYN